MAVKLVEIKLISRVTRCESLISLIAALAALTVLLNGVSCVVVYQVRFIASKAGRTDHALAGESIELSCHYIMKDEAEDIKQLIWSKDGKNIFRWTKNVPGIEVLNYTYKGHIDSRSTHSHITIHNTTIQMHGKYRCSVKTDLNIHEAEQDLTVISQSNCKLNDWRVISQPSKCSEFFRLDCRNMFPKPVTSCGLWNGKVDKLIRAVTVDINEETNKQTYRVSYIDNYQLQFSNGEPNPKFSDLLQYAGHLVFKCDIIVPETSWKLSLVHRMFDFNDGCHQDPLDTIDRLRLNYSNYATNRMQKSGYLLKKHSDEFEMLGANLKYDIVPPSKSNLIWPKMSGTKAEVNCWQKPRLGSLARLSCASKSKHQFKLTGASTLECQTSGWVPITESNLDLKKLSSSPAPIATGMRTERRVGLNSGDSPDVSTESDLTPTLSNDLEALSSSTTSTDSSLDSVSSTDIEFIPTTQNDVLFYDRPTNTMAGWNNLSPSELAYLLPSCISTHRRYHPYESKHNRLPLIEGAKVMESSNRRNHTTDDIDFETNFHHPRSDYAADKPHASHKSLFEFAFSSSHIGPIANLAYEQVLMLTINLVVTLVALPIYLKSFKFTPLIMKDG